MGEPPVVPKGFPVVPVLVAVVVGFSIGLAVSIAIDQRKAVKPPAPCAGCEERKLDLAPPGKVRVEDRYDQEKGEVVKVLVIDDQTLAADAGD